MKKKVYVISLGGSRIVPEEVDYKFIEDFKETIEKHPSHKFAVVCGGGSIARKYISILKKLKKPTKKQSLLGIEVTKINATLLMKIFGKKANKTLPGDMREVKNLLRKNQIVFCGALRYAKKQTSDATAAKLAAYLKCPFINITNVKGLYNKNPKTNKNAKFIKKTSAKKLVEMMDKIKYKAGQHFIIDQSAAEIILKEKIPTYIISSPTELDKIIKGKKFIGTFVN